MGNTSITATMEPIQAAPITGRSTSITRRAAGIPASLLQQYRDVPEVITEGDTREEALLRAEDALESALAMYCRQGAAASVVRGGGKRGYGAPFAVGDGEN